MKAFKAWHLLLALLLLGSVGFYQLSLKALEVANRHEMRKMVLVSIQDPTQFNEEFHHKLRRLAEDANINVEEFMTLFEKNIDLLKAYNHASLEDFILMNQKRASHQSASHVALQAKLIKAGVITPEEIKLRNEILQKHALELTFSIDAKDQKPSHQDLYSNLSEKIGLYPNMNLIFRILKTKDWMPLPEKFYEN